MFTDRLNRFLKSDEEKIAEADIISLLKDSPQLEALERERDEKILAQQRELDAQIEQLEHDRDQTMPPLVAEVLEALEANQKLRDASTAGEQREQRAEHARLSASLGFSFEIEKLKAQRAALAWREIDESIYEFHAVAEKARWKFKIDQWPGPKARMTTGEVKEVIFESNLKAISGLREYIKNAIAQAQELKLLALPRAEIIQRLNALKTQLPNFRHFDSDTTSIPLPDVRELRRW